MLQICCTANPKQMETWVSTLHKAYTQPILIDRTATNQQFSTISAVTGFLKP